MGPGHGGREGIEGSCLGPAPTGPQVARCQGHIFLPPCDLGKNPGAGTHLLCLCRRSNAAWVVEGADQSVGC